jgi:MOSC domain-containing protein YiiM
MTHNGRVLSVNVAVPMRSTAKNVGITGINKVPVSHPVAVRAPGPKATGLHSGLVGDQIFDVKNHGGDGQAVYAYAREDYSWWSAELGRELPGGIFGENLTTEGVAVSTAVVGELWHIGEGGLVLSPTYPRIPCATFQARMNEPRWVRRFSAANRTGAYLRVVHPGDVRAGDAIVVTDVPAHGVTVADAFDGWMHHKIEVEDLIAQRLPA